MLYISRYIGLNEFGVVDTDDGVEEVVTLQQVIRACGPLNVQIAGVETHIRGFSYGKKSFVDSVLAYQDPITKTSLQLKLSLLGHVDVVTYGNMITNVLWDFDKIKEPVFVCLSDFGSCCGDRILWGNANRGEHKITLILNDKIEFGPKTFRLSDKEQRWSVGIDGVGVMFDIHELHDDYKAQLVYQALMIDEVFDLLLLESVIDSEERKQRMVERFLKR